MNKKQQHLEKISLDPKITAKAVGLRYVNNQQAKNKKWFHFKDRDDENLRFRKHVGA